MYTSEGTVTIPIKEYNELQNLKTRIAKLRKVARLKAEPNADLTEKEQDVIHFIRSRPGSSKQDVVNALVKHHSRATIWKIIDQLLQYGFLVAKSDPHNRQTWNLFVDSNNTIVMVSDEIHLIEKQFSSIIKVLHKAQADPNLEMVAMAYNFTFDLSYVYTYLANMYFIYALVEWPKNKDKYILDKLYAILFSKLVDILQMLNDIHQTYIDRDDFYSFKSNELFFRSDVPYLLQQNFIIDMRARAEILGVEEYVDSLLDVVWRIGYNLLHKREQYTELEILDIEEYSNWRQFLEIDLHQPKRFTPISSDL